jgi:hypothetical protein
MENHAKYGDSIYFHQGARRLFVNLFIASELSWKDAGLTVRQVTRFPEEPGTTLTVRAAAPVTTTLSLRKPSWAGPGFAVTVNGTPVPATPGPDGYVDLTRAWKDGDTIAMTLPMTFRWEGFRDNPNRTALMYGPVLLIAKTEPGNREAVVTASPDRALSALKPDDKPLHFTGDSAVFSRGPGSSPTRFLPMYQEYQDPYIAYWELRDAKAAEAIRAAYAAEAARWTKLAPRTRDIVFFDMGTPSAASTLPGRLATDPALPRTPGADRTEKDHALEAHSGYNHEFNLPHRLIAGLWQTFRTAELGPDRFSWNLAVEPGKPHTLLVRLWSPPADDLEARRATDCSLEVRVSQAAPAAPTGGTTAPVTEGNQLATGPGIQARSSTLLGVIGPAPADGTFRDVTFPLPAVLVANQEQLTVTFVRPPGKVAGLVAEVRVLGE